MTVTTRHTDAAPTAVWDVLADGWLYPLWVVGAARMREVDDSWPAVGSRLHHSVGLWPVLLDDTTSVLACDPGHHLELKARAWPAGTAKVGIELRPAGGDTDIVMEEHPADGPATMIPEPVTAPLLRWRNVEALRRLAALAEGRGGPA